MALVFAASVATRWFVEKRGLVMGLLTAATATGQLIFLPGLSHLVMTHGWKSVSIAVGGSALAVVPFIAIFLKESPQSMGLAPYGAPMDWEPPQKSPIPPARLAVQTLRESISRRDFWILFGSFFVCGLSTNGLIGTHFIPAAHDHGMMETVAAGLLAMVGVFDVIGTVVDARKLLFFYYLTRGLSLFLLPSILFRTVHPSTLVFVIFYGLDWVATVPPTVMLSRVVLGPNRGLIVYGWVFAGHQIGASVAAFGAALLRIKFGDYAVAFYISATFCIVTAFAVLQIARGKSSVELRG
jgi:hypothetical protein